MIKTEMMKKYEAYSGETLEEAEKRGKTLAFLSKYTRWLEAKASAYDRVMSGEPTAKEIANVLNRIIAMDADLKWYAFGVIPYGTTKFRWLAVRGSTKYRVPCFHIKFDGDWKDSLTFPDGWEEK